MNETLSVTDREEGGTCHFSSEQILLSCVSPPPTSPPLLHLGSDDSIGSSFKRISITETVFSLSVQASSHISASLSCLLFHSVPLLFPGRGLLRFYVTSVCVGCKSTDRYCLFLGNQKRRAWSWNANSLGKKSLPFCWHWCHFRMQQTG